MGKSKKRNASPFKKTSVPKDLVSVHVLLLVGVGVGVNGKVRIVACSSDSAPVCTIACRWRIERTACGGDWRHDIRFGGGQCSAAAIRNTLPNLGSSNASAINSAEAICQHFPWKKSHGKLTE